MKKNMQVAVLVTQPYVNQYIYDFIVKLSEEKNISLDCLIVANQAKSADSKISATSAFFLRAILFFERMFLFRNFHCRDHTNQSFDLRTRFARIVEINLDNLSAMHAAGKEDTSLSEAKVDLILNLGDEPDNIALFTSYSALGLISAEFSNDSQNENLIAGFWEVLCKRDTTHFTINQVFKDRAKSRLLDCKFQTRYCFLLNRVLLYKKSGIHLHNFIKQFAIEGHLPASVKSVHSDEPSIRHEKLVFLECALYVARTLAIVFKKILRRWLSKGVRWHVVICKTRFKSTFACEPRVVPNPPNRFLADPFVISKNNKTYCFVEDASNRTKKGRISYFEVDENLFSEIKPCLEEEFHLSFPFIFEYQNDLYMCPETSDAGQIRIYKASAFPREWKLETVLMDQVRAVDTMLFESAGKWWMLTNIDPSKIGANGAELYLFFADSPLSTHWTAHPLNPVFVDSTKARNGGLIFCDGEIYRVGQRQGFDQYGADFSVYRITELSQTNYQEVLTERMRPDRLPAMMGTHHLSTAGEFSAMDFYNIE